MGIQVCIYSFSERKDSIKFLELSLYTHNCPRPLGMCPLHPSLGIIVGIREVFNKLRNYRSVTCQEEDLNENPEARDLVNER